MGQNTKIVQWNKWVYFGKELRLFVYTRDSAPARTRVFASGLRLELNSDIFQRSVFCDFLDILQIHLCHLQGESDIYLFVMFCVCARSFPSLSYYNHFFLSSAILPQLGIPIIFKFSYSLLFGFKWNLFCYFFWCFQPVPYDEHLNHLMPSYMSLSHFTL